MGFLGRDNFEVKSFGDAVSAAPDTTPTAGFGDLGNIPAPPDVSVPEGFETQGFAPTSAPVSDLTEETPAMGSNAVDAGDATQGIIVEPGFTIVDQDSAPFAKDFSPEMKVSRYTGDTNMLLRYLFEMERKHGITMPIQACGVDPLVFEFVERTKLETEEDDAVVTVPFFTIPGTGAEDEVAHLYELITVDDQVFLSCASECLNAEYLHQIISEATTSIMENGSYIFRMVGLRRLSSEHATTEQAGCLLETLRLNTFEMSTLCSYMEGFNVVPSFEVINGHQCICFRVE